jgi:DNA-binding NarL/FixJ family response regulator
MVAFSQIAPRPEVTASMTRILVVDDHPLVRRGVVQVLLDAFPAGEVGEASSPAEAMEKVTAERWSLVVLDISLPGRNGIDLLKDIKAARPATPVLMLSGHPEAQFSTRSLRAGASGYLTKQSDPALLVEAARQIIKGGKFITPATAEMLASELQFDASKAPHERLSDREYDVMLKIACGRSVGEIAEVMNLSAKTVSTYRTRILTKFGSTNNAELTHYALRNKLIE